MTEYHFNAEDLIVFCPMKLKANILYTMLADPVFVFLSVEEKRRLYLTSGRVGGGGSLGLFGWGCAVGTLESLAYTRASSSEFCYPILD